MKKGYFHILWILAVLILSALVLGKIETWESKRVAQNPGPKKTALVMLIGYAGEDFPGSENSDAYKTVGCGDALITYEIPVVTARLTSVLNALSAFEPPDGLHNPMKEKGIRIEEISERPRGSVLVELLGEPEIGGNCDAPRLKGQIEETIALYTKNAEIRLNGTAEQYECLANVYGRCT